ncbi:hypothetical protein [Sphingomonas sp.]|uniref:hypothetical protein n=1 Tax=Sphingomonas sp. TaxID=28214 RepID=UPI003B00E64F
MRTVNPPANPAQARHRAMVGAVGLGLVLLLIALASIVLRSVTREVPVMAPGGAKPDIVANMALGNEVAADTAPLSDMGVTPGVKNESAARR